MPHIVHWKNNSHSSMPLKKTKTRNIITWNIICSVKLIMLWRTFSSFIEVVSDGKLIIALASFPFRITYWIGKAALDRFIAFVTKQSWIFGTPKHRTNKNKIKLNESHSDSFLLITQRELILSLLMLWYKKYSPGSIGVGALLYEF